MGDRCCDRARARNRTLGRRPKVGRARRTRPAREDAAAIRDVGDVLGAPVSEQRLDSDHRVRKRMVLHAPDQGCAQRQEHVVHDRNRVRPTQPLHHQGTHVVGCEAVDAVDVLRRITDAKPDIICDKRRYAGQLLRPQAFVSADRARTVGAHKPQAVGIAVAETEQAKRRTAHSAREEQAKLRTRREGGVSGAVSRLEAVLQARRSRTPRRTGHPRTETTSDTGRKRGRDKHPCRDHERERQRESRVTAHPALGP